MTESASRIDAVDTLKRPSRWGQFAFWCLSVTLLCVSAVAMLEKRNVNAQLATLQSEAVGLRKLHDRVNKHGDMLKQVKRTLSETLGTAREPADLPTFEIKRIVSQHRMERLTFWVPKGEHTLVVDAAWGPPSKRKARFRPDDSTAKQKQWTIPLKSPGGYIFELIVEKVDQPVGWTLQSNRDEFDRREETLPIHGFDNSSSSSGQVDVFMYPNQVPGLLLSDMQKLFGGQVFQTTFRGKTDDGVSMSLSVQAHIQSAGPPAVTLQTAMIMIGRGEKSQLMPYDGSGRYFLREDSMLAAETKSDDP